MHVRLNTYLGISTILALTGCMTGVMPADGPADGQSTSFLLAGAVEDETPEARAVLDLANRASLEVLDDDVGLDRRAAHNIDDYRVGSDGVPLTADDEVFDTLEELDAISYVGPSAFAKLLEYAQDNGYGMPDGGAEEVTPETTATLDLVNRASLETLDDDVRLDSRAARNIVDYRLGADATNGTSDDETFNTLEELSDISYVGPSALAKLLEYALAHGYGTPGAPVAYELPVVACDGDFSPSEVQQAHRAGGWLDLHLSRYTRECDENAGVKNCTDWVTTTLPGARQAYGGHTDEAFSTVIDVSDASPALAATGVRSSTYKGSGEFLPQADGTTRMSLTFTYRGYTNVCDVYSYGGGWGSGGCLRSHYDYWNATWMTLTGQVSDSCLVLATDIVRSHDVDFGGGNISYRETVDMALSGS